MIETKRKPAVIEEFTGQWRFLSNFYRIPMDIVWEELRYPSVEHAFQSAKTLDRKLRLKFVTDACVRCGYQKSLHRVWSDLGYCPKIVREHRPGSFVVKEWYGSKCFNEVNPGQAKRMGRKLVLRRDWESVKLDVMLQLVRLKFAGVLRPNLARTGDAELIEGNTWNDQFWGVSFGKGENHLGKILMQVRVEIREEGDPVAATGR